MEDCVLDNPYNLRSRINYLRHTCIRRETNHGPTRNRHSRFSDGNILSKDLMSNMTAC